MEVIVRMETIELYSPGEEKAGNKAPLERSVWTIMDWWQTVWLKSDWQRIRNPDISTFSSCWSVCWYVCIKQGVNIQQRSLEIFIFRDVYVDVFLLGKAIGSYFILRNALIAHHFFETMDCLYSLSQLIWDLFSLGEYRWALVRKALWSCLVSVCHCTNKGVTYSKRL